MRRSRFASTDRLDGALIYVALDDVELRGFARRPPPRRLPAAIEPEQFDGLIGAEASSRSCPSWKSRRVSRRPGGISTARTSLTLDPLRPPCPHLLVGCPRIHAPERADAPQLRRAHCPRRARGHRAKGGSPRLSTDHLELEVATAVLGEVPPGWIPTTAIRRKPRRRLGPGKPGDRGPGASPRARSDGGSSEVHPERGHISIDVVDPAHWPEHPAQLHVALIPHNPTEDTPFFDLPQLSSGHALDRSDGPARHSDVPAAHWAASHAGEVLLVDEPEAGLHPLAVIDVVRWLEDRLNDYSGVIVATHHPEFLRSSNPSVSAILVNRTEGGWVNCPRSHAPLLRRSRGHCRSVWVHTLGTPPVDSARALRRG